MMNEEGAFSRLLELIHAHMNDEEASLQRQLLELLYEMSRIQRIRVEDLSEWYHGQNVLGARPSFACKKEQF